MCLTPEGIYYEENGDGDSLVMLHGVTLDGRMWADQIEHFGSSWRCFAVDRRGHGRSAPLIDGFSVDADLLAVLDHAGVDQCSLVGLSLGGSDALGFAGRNPTRVRALVLVDAWLPGPEIGEWSPPVDVARRLGPPAAREAWLADPIFDASRSNERAHRRLEEMVAAHDFSTWIRRVAPPVPLPPLARDLAHSVRQPTLVVIGEREIPPFRNVAAWLQRTIPGSATIGIQTVSGAGHIPPVEAPDAFNSILERFLSGIRISAPRRATA